MFYNIVCTIHSADAKLGRKQIRFILVFTERVHEGNNTC